MSVLGNNVNVTVYVGAIANNVPRLFFLDAILRERKVIEKNLWNMFQWAPGEASFDFLRVVSDPAEADFFLLPHDYYSLQRAENHSSLAELIGLAEKHKKKIIIFLMGDSDEHVEIPYSIIFRYSQYGYKKKDNEIIAPPYPLHFRPPELSGYREKIWRTISLREKSAKPTVSFCGWADFPSFYRRCTYAGRVLLADIKKYIFRDKYAELHKPAIYFRRKAVRALAKTARIETNFILRRSFSAQKGFYGKEHIKPEIAEKEYMESIIHSDFVLSPRGHANASIRFFEALGLGRFPVLINTDCELPLKDYIDYGKFVVTVEHTRIEETERAILDFYNSLTAEEFKKRQLMAREAFELLRPGSFLKIVLSQLKNTGNRYT